MEDKKSIKEKLEELKAKAKSIPHEKPISKIRALEEEKRKAKREFRKKEGLPTTPKDVDKNLKNAIQAKISNTKSAYFGKTPDELLADKRFSIGAKATYALLDKFSQKAKGIPIPVAETSYKTMKSCLGISSDDTLRKYLKELEKGGWIDVVRQGVKMPNKYLVYGKNCNELYKMMNVHKKIQNDGDLRKKLTGNLNSDHLNNRASLNEKI